MNDPVLERGMKWMEGNFKYTWTHYGCDCSQPVLPHLS